jgi:demethylmenaquinone methyltransferase/2-methoxy-6-polyprenyl-1,4-benzoquinol methylase
MVARMTQPLPRDDANASAADAAGVGANEGGDTTHFGFTDVPIAEKSARVGAVFDSVAARYDLMNDLMSAGVHRLWKATFVRRLGLRPGAHVLDVAGGTGDIAFRMLDRLAGDGRVTVCDINREMLAVGATRAIDRGFLPAAGALDWVCGDAEALPFADMSVDAYTIAFGLRNVTRIDRALAEARRVLTPGGRFFCLEFSHVVVPVLAALYERYSFAVLPRIGQLVASDRDAYQYLVESIRRFPPQNELLERMAAAGLSRGRYENLSGGIVAIHSGWRL